MEIPTRPLDEQPEDSDQGVAESAETNVLVKARISHHWRGDYYSQDSLIVASERAVKANVKAGLWYYDSGDPEWDSTLTTQADEEDCGC